MKVRISILYHPFRGRLTNGINKNSISQNFWIKFIISENDRENSDDKNKLIIVILKGSSFIFHKYFNS